MTRCFIFLLLIARSLAGATSTGRIADFATANLVLGQQDFKHGEILPKSSSTFYDPKGIAIDPISRKVFVSDHMNSRILRFKDARSLTNGAEAEAIFGQILFTDWEPSIGASRLNQPQGIFLDAKGRLWVADSRNNRVVVYHDAAQRQSGAPADHVYGAPDFSSPGSTARSASSMNTPTGICVDSEDRLWVADNDNDRILRFDAISIKSDGAPADGVLGPPDFTTYVMPGMDKILMNPFALAVSAGGTLFVIDSNRRVIRYDHAKDLSGAVFPDAVLGQPDLWSTLYGAGKTRFYATGVACTENTLWVTDSGNCRLLRFDNVSTKVNGAPANGIIGQPDYFSIEGETNAKRLSAPFGSPCLDVDGNLWICDLGNQRVLRYSRDSTPPNLKLANLLPATPVYKYFKIRVIATDENSISGVYYRIGTRPYRAAVFADKRWETSTDIPWKKGVNSLEFYAVDTAGNRSPSLKIRVRSTGTY